MQNSQEFVSFLLGGGKYQLNIFLHVTQTETQHAGEWCDPWPWDIK